MKHLILITFAATSITAGCAQRANTIKPEYLSANDYAAFNCQQLTNMIHAERYKLGIVSARQNDAAANDAMGVFLVGLPTSSIAGSNRKNEISYTKGKINALGEMHSNKKCGSQKIVVNNDFIGSSITNDIIYPD